MKITGYIVLACFALASCNRVVEKPSDLISKDKMAEIMADFALNEQTPMMNPEGNQEEGTRYILKHHKVTAKAFTDSYKYYLVEKKMEGIIEDAQDIIIKKDPKAKEYIESKMKPGLTPSEPKLNLR